MRRYYDEVNEGKKDNFSIVRLMKKYNFDRTHFGSSEFEVTKNELKKLFPGSSADMYTNSVIYSFEDTSIPEYDENEFFFNKIERYLKGFKLVSTKEYKTPKPGFNGKHGRTIQLNTLRAYFNKDDGKIAIVKLSDYWTIIDDRPQGKYVSIKVFNYGEVNEDYERGYLDGRRVYLKENSNFYSISANMDGYEFEEFLEDSELMDDPYEYVMRATQEGIYRGSSQSLIMKIKRLQDKIMDYLNELGDEAEIDINSKHYYSEVWDEISDSEKKKVVKMVADARIPYKENLF